MPLPFSRTTPLLLLSALVWTMSTATAQIVDTPGGWNIVAVTQNDSSLLTRALQNETNYSANVKERVCVFEVHSAAQHTSSHQVIDRRYNVQACPVTTIQSAGMCATTVLATDGSCGEYAIQLYEQTTTDTLQVRAVTLIRTQADKSKKASATSAATATLKSAAVGALACCSTVLTLVNVCVTAFAAIN